MTTQHTKVSIVMQYLIQTLSSLNNKTTLTTWMNHLSIIYAFLLPISHYADSFIFFLILIIFLFRRNFEEYLLPLFTNKVIQAFLIFYLLHIIWLLGTENFDQAKQVLKFSQYALFPIVFFSFMDKRFSPYLLGAFIIGIFFSELFSYSIQLHIIEWKLTLASIPIYQASGIDDPSPFLHHSFYATSLAFVSSLLIYKLKTGLTFFEKIISLFFLISITVNLFTVGGRIGYVLYIILILFTIIYMYKGKVLKPLIIATIAIASVFLLAYTFSPIATKRIEETKHITQQFLNGNMNYLDSLGSRVGFSYYSLKVIKENLLFGVGTGDYMDEVRKIIPEAPNNHFIKNIMEHPHNIYIMVLLQFGIIGLIVYFNIFYQIYHQITTDCYLKFVKYSIMLTILIALITETFTAPYYFPLFVLIVSSALATTNLPKEFKPIFSKQIYLSYFILICLAAINAKLHFIIPILKNQL